MLSFVFPTSRLIPAHIGRSPARVLRQSSSDRSRVDDLSTDGRVGHFARAVASALTNTFTQLTMPESTSSLYPSRIIAVRLSTIGPYHPSTPILSNDHPNQQWKTTTTIPRSAHSYPIATAYIPHALDAFVVASAAIRGILWLALRPRLLQSLQS